MDYIPNESFSKEKKNITNYQKQTPIKILIINFKK